MIVLMEWYIYLALALFGAIFGSFAGAAVWRIRARQLVTDKKGGEKVDAKELARLKKLTKQSALKDRSQCLHCSYELKWYDLIPVVSWLSLGGKCRSCRTPIGRFELLIELGMAAFFVLSYALWPLPLESALDITRFVLWLAAGVVLGILFAYDSKWFLLPDGGNLLLALIGAGIVTIAAIQSPNPLEVVLSAVGAVGVLSGLYLLIHLLSKGRWVGFGDVKLGVGLGLILVDWQLALLTLFLANLLGSLIVIPLLALGKIKRNAHVPFGPMLIAGTIIAFFVGWPIIEWYLTGFGLY